MPRPVAQPLLLQIIGGIAALDALVGLLTAGSSFLAPALGGTRDLRIVAVGIGIVALALPVVYSLWTERPWARECLLTVAALILLLPVVAQVLLTGFPVSDMLRILTVVLTVEGLVALPVLWYLYRKPNVVAYFRSLPERAPPESLNGRGDR